MTRKIISLNDSNWRVGSVAQKPFGDVNDLADVTEWLPAQVPGDVRLDLLRAGKISDPFYADNNESSQWVDTRDWWYVRDTNLELAEDEHAFLIFDGIDYQSAIFWNGKQLNRYAGMFSRQIVELGTEDRRRKTEKTSSVVGHPSSLAVRIWGSNALPKLHRTLAQRLWGRLIAPFYSDPYNPPYPDRFATLKCQMQFGWDFAPRLRTCGIWDDAQIVVTRSVFIQDAQLKSQVQNPKSKVANIAVTLSIDSDQEQNARIAFTVRGKNYADEPRTFSFDIHLRRGFQVRDFSFDLTDVRWWSPWDRGEPNLYEVEIAIVKNGATKQFLTMIDASLDSCLTTFGIRSFELARPPMSREPWQFVINGEREFLRGANWVPVDAIPGRLTRADYAARLQQARDANINLLRVWGGGLREKQAFYNLCDELGILVWQEFPLAGAVLDRFPTDRAHLQHIRDECGGIVRALRNHPSIVVWCGGNEFSTRGNQAIVKKLRAVVKDKDGTRPFKPASPYKNESHNWSVWHRFANLRDYRKDMTPFLSEFGLQSLPNLESLKKFLPDEALQSPHPLWEYHHAQMKKLGRYAQPVRDESLSQSMTTEKFIEATQRGQALGLQIAIEHMRRRKGETTGVAIWQFNDPWPCISWSVIDYYGTPKRAYNELRRLYSPVFASFDYELLPRRAGDLVHGNVWLINDWLKSFENIELRAELNSTEIYTRCVNLAANSSQKMDKLAVTLSGGENILRLLARDGKQILSDHSYDLNFCDIGEINPIGAFLVTAAKKLMR